jgi:hypothetical protein
VVCVLRRQKQHNTNNLCSYRIYRVRLTSRQPLKLTALQLMTEHFRPADRDGAVLAQRKS